MPYCKHGANTVISALGLTYRAGVLLLLDPLWQGGEVERGCWSILLWQGGVIADHISGRLLCSPPCALQKCHRVEVWQALGDFAACLRPQELSAHYGWRGIAESGHLWGAPCSYNTKQGLSFLTLPLQSQPHNGRRSVNIAVGICSRASFLSDQLELSK